VIVDASQKPPEWWPSRFPRLWPFLNSTFGLWLLSTVVVGGLGTLYTKNQNDQAEAIKRLELTQVETLKTATLVDRLDLEIGYRLSSVISRMYELHASISRCSAQSNKKNLCQSAKDKLDEIFLSRHKPQTMFPEYAAYSTLALVAELTRVAPENEKKELEQVIYDMSGLYDMLEVQRVRLDDPKAVAGAIHQKLLLRRWVRGFYYLDCNQKEPFC
jgi:hypothetical protein